MAGGFAGHWEVAKLVDDEELRAVPESHRVRPAAVERGAAGAGDEVGGGCVVDAVAGFDRPVSEDRGEHRFAGAGRSDRQNVGLVFDESEGGEVFDEASVEGGLGGEVELVKRPAGREF